MVLQNHNKMLALTILLARLFMADFFNMIIFSFIINSYLNHYNTRISDILMLNSLKYIFILTKITASKLQLTEEGRPFYNYLNNIVKYYE